MKKNTAAQLIIASLMCTSLTNCAAPFAAGAAVGGAVCGTLANDRRNMSTIAGDQTIRHQVGIRLASATRLHNSRIVIAVFNHVVLLAGEVKTPAQRQLAEDIAHTVPDVKRVYNGLEVGEPIGTIQQSKDTWITTQVHARIIADVDLNDSQIKVLTENGTVFLMGIVTKHQADAATIEAKNVPNVKRIVKLFEYAHVPHG